MNIENTVQATPVEYDADLRKALAIAPEGLMCEFGTATGRYIRNMAEIASPRKFYGFDSWEGLPEPWGPVDVGAFKVDPPTDLPPNVELVKGLFQDSLKPWLLENNQPIAFCHFDADLYSSTKYVLDTLIDWFAQNAILMFDQITDQTFGGFRERYRREGEGRAMQEWHNENPQYKIECIGRHKRDGAIFKIWK